jgi:hypothetical protein
VHSEVGLKRLVYILKTVDQPTRYYTGAHTTSPNGWRSTTTAEVHLLVVIGLGCSTWRLGFRRFTCLRIREVPRVGFQLRVREATFPRAYDQYVACAIAGRATFIVTSDADLLTVRQHEGVRIVTPE